MKKSPRKLALSRETLGRIEGGIWPAKPVPTGTCPSENACTFSCGCSLGSC